MNLFPPLVVDRQSSSGIIRKAVKCGLVRRQCPLVVKMFKVAWWRCLYDIYGV